MPTVAEWRQKAEQGDLAAMYELGHCYFSGREGVSEDFEQAVVWFRQAADQGHADAMHMLGVCYHDGEGVPQDYAGAYVCYHNAIAAGSTNGSPENNLGCMFEHGEGVVQSLSEAYKWYRAGSAKGNHHAMDQLSRFYSEFPSEWSGWVSAREVAEQREKDRLATETAGR